MSLRSVIVDTSAIYALVDTDDPHHQEAARYLRQLGRGVSLLVAEPTLLETVTLIKGRLGSAIALRTLQSINASNRYRVTRLTEADYAETWRLLEQYSDKSWSPFDCACLAVARSRQITEAFAFDNHFDQMAAAGLLRVPRRD
jgi:predicted nucleic acid-binding protein